MPDLKTKVVFAVPRVHKYIQLYETEYVCILVFFDMFINENMFSRPSNHFCQPTRRGQVAPWPRSKAMAPMSTLSMSTITRPATKKNGGVRNAPFHGDMGYDYDDQQ